MLMTEHYSTTEELVGDGGQLITPHLYATPGYDNGAYLYQSMGNARWRLLCWVDLTTVTTLLKAVGAWDRQGQWKAG